MYLRFNFRNHLRAQAVTAILIQIVTVALIAFIWCWCRDISAGFDTLLGGLAWILPNILFTTITRYGMQNRNAMQMLRMLFIAEIIKLTLATSLIILALTLVSVKFMPFLTGYLGAVIVIYFFPLFFRHKLI